MNQLGKNFQANTALPETGYVRLKKILGDPKADPPIPPIVPISKSSWYAGIKAGKYPRSIKLGPRTSAWRVSDIRALVENGIGGRRKNP